MKQNYATASILTAILLASTVTVRGQGGNAILTPASGGLAIPADTAGGAYTTLTGPIYQEGAPGDVGTGTIVLNVPTGFVFDATAVVTVLVNGGSAPLHNINDLPNGSLIPAVVTQTNITITITAKSSNGLNNKLTWQNVRVRPTAGSPLASGNITKSGTAGVTGVTSSSNLGTLREVVGVANTLLLSGFPGSTTAGVSESVTVTLIDESGNLATNYTGTIHFTSSDAQAVLPADYMFVSADAGVHTFTSSVTLKTAGIQSITATDVVNPSLSGSESGIAVSPAAAAQLVFLTQPGSAVYGSALSSQPVLKTQDAYGNDSTVGLGVSQIVALSLSAGSGPLVGSTSLDIGTSAGNGTVSFSGLTVNSAGPGKQLTASASGLSSAVSSAFAINPANLTASANSASRIYGAANPPLSGSIAGIQNGDNITATYSTTATVTSPVGSYSIVPAVNDPDGKLGNYMVTVSNGTLSVTGASSANNVISSVSPSGQGSNVTFTSTIVPVAPASGTVSGNVQFYVNGAAAGGSVTLNDGVASFSTGALAAGSNTVMAVYSGDGNFLGSTGTVVQVVMQSVPAPGNLTLQNNSDGTKTVAFTGAPGAQYLIQATTILIPANWTTIGTGTADGDGKISFIDPDAGLYSSRFYRAAAPSAQ